MLYLPQSTNPSRQRLCKSLFLQSPALKKKKKLSGGHIPMGLVAFSENTRNLSLGPNSLRKAPEEFCLHLILNLRSAELTRGLVHLAIATENQYQNVVGSTFGVVSTSEAFWVKTLQTAQKMVIKYQKQRMRSPPTLFIPITRVALPPAPPVPIFPPPSITEADLEIYIKPLITNGWALGNIPKSFTSRHGCPALRRRFPHATLPEGSISRWTLRILRWMWARSASLQKARPKSMAFHITLRFALEVESKFAENWAGGAENATPHSRTLPRTMEELWNGKGLVLSPRPGTWRTRSVKKKQKVHSEISATT
ncbi:hypothetical protein C8R44DRAFT_727006 [Mycena epipterygia]|nr:hypothetical protein C8R44DRAFT_727006 [Mycena epipterygia]